jgi:hypothetical protein
MLRPSSAHHTITRLAHVAPQSTTTLRRRIAGSTSPQQKTQKMPFLILQDLKVYSMMYRRICIMYCRILPRQQRLLQLNS